MMFLLVIVLGLAGIALWLAIMMRWRLGIFGLLIVLPFVGILTLKLHPSKLPLLFKDVAFIIPAYLSFFVLHAREIRAAPVPRPVLLSLLGLAVLVLLQAMNPLLENWMVAAIGVKVWLFYIPLIFLGGAYIGSRDDLARLLRVLVVIAIVPCAIGVLQWLGALAFGYESVMTGFYGNAARDATQNFATHTYGGTLFRIPSTFTFVSQYFGFTFAMVVFGYCLMRAERTASRSRFALVMIGVFVASSILSGARGALVFVPLLLALTVLLDQRLSGILALVVLLPVVVLLAMDLGGLDPMTFILATRKLVGFYSEDIVYDKLVEALTRFPLGTGTGMNTGAARHAFGSKLDVASLVRAGELYYLENYYAKAVVELGLPGLFATIAMFASLIGCGLGVLRRLEDPALRGCAAAIVAFIITIAIHSSKGWQIEYDPVNVYFWLMIGILFKLPSLDTAPAGAPTAGLRARPAPAQMKRGRLPMRHPGARLR